MPKIEAADVGCGDGGYDAKLFQLLGDRLYLHCIDDFKYKRVSSLDWLVKQAQNHHYSTFNLYTEKEFAQSLDKFKQNLQLHFRDLKNIKWFDENILLVIRKQERWKRKR